MRAQVVTPGFFEVLRTQPVLTLFLIIGMGYLIGNIRVGSFSLGPVAGVLFEITAEQMAAMDREEFDPARDTSGLGRREQRVVRTADGSVKAELYTVRDDGGWRAPSERYLGHILHGLEAAGHEEAVLADVRRIAASGGGC